MIRQGARTRLPTVRGVSLGLGAVKATAGLRTTSTGQELGKPQKGRDKRGHTESVWQGVKHSFLKGQKTRKERYRKEREVSGILQGRDDAGLEQE